MPLTVTQMLVAGFLAAAGGGALGWLAHRLGEAGRRQVHEAYCREMVNGAHTARDRAREEGSLLEERLAGARRKLERTQRELEALRKAELGLRETSREAVERAGDLQGRVAELERGIGARDIELEALRDKARELDAARTGAETALAQAREAVEQLAGPLERYRGDVARLQAELQRAREAHGGCSEKIAALESELHAREGLRGQLRERERELAAARAQGTQAERRVAELEDTRGKEQRRRAALEERIVQAEAQHRSAETRIEALHEQIAELNKRVTERDRALRNGRPQWLLEAPRGTKDDLQALRGLGPVLEQRLNALGVFHFWQLARMTHRDTEWLASRLHLPTSRIVRGDWVGQARGRSG